MTDVRHGCTPQHRLFLFYTGVVTSYILLILCIDFGLPYLDKPAAAARSTLTTPTGVCDVDMFMSHWCMWCWHVYVPLVYVMLTCLCHTGVCGVDIYVPLVYVMLTYLCPSGVCDVDLFMSHWCMLWWCVYVPLVYVMLTCVCTTDAVSYTHLTLPTTAEV